jgi:hypothetical protein
MPQITGAFSATTSTGAGINVNLGSSLLIYGSGAQNFTCTSSPSYGILLTVGSSAQTTTTGAMTITNCSNGIRALWNSVFIDGANGTRTITNSANPASADQLATYDHGNFPTGNCGVGAECP